MLSTRDKWFLRLVALVCLAGGVQIILFGELGAPTTDSTYQFNGVERLFGLWPLLLSWFFYWCSKPNNEDPPKFN